MAGWVQALHPQVQWCCPQLPPSPQEAFELLLRITADWPWGQTALVGSSLGGFYANCLAAQIGCPAVLINPAVQPARDLARHVGMQQAWHDPTQSFDFQPKFVNELENLQKSLKTPSNEIFAIVAQGDEVLDWREMTAHLAHARIKLLPGSDHALSDVDDHRDDILNFLKLV